MKRIATFWVATFAAILHTTPITAAAADPYPSGTVRLVTSQAPGGAADVLGRAMAQELGAIWKQPVVVENKTGAAGAIAADAVARADAHALLIGSAGMMAIAPAMGPTPGYSVDDFKPLIHVASQSLVFVVNSNSGVKSLNDLIAASKKKPGGLSYGSVGRGSTSQIASAMLLRSAGVPGVEVAYRGEPPAIIDLRGGNIDFMVLATSTAAPHVRSGHLTALGVTSPTRSALMPDVPTVAESGWRDFDVGQWYGIYAPVNTSADVANRIITALRAAVAKESVQKEINNLGLDATRANQRDFAAFDRTERARWGQLLKANAQAAR